MIRLRILKIGFGVLLIAAMIQCLPVGANAQTRELKCRNTDDTNDVMQLIINYDAHTVKFWDEDKPNAVNTSPITITATTITWKQSAGALPDIPYSLDLNSLKLTIVTFVESDYLCE
jgi:hypothetical protein